MGCISVQAYRTLDLPPLLPIVVGNEMIMPTEYARNIGVMFDHNLTMDQQITSVCKSAFFHISNIRKIRKYISQHAAPRGFKPDTETLLIVF